MKFKDLKENMFGDFLRWLDAKKIGDCFSNDVWANQAFNILFEQYKEENKNAVVLDNFIKNAPVTILEDIIKKRKEKEQKIQTPHDKKIIVPGSK